MSGPKEYRADYTEKIARVEDLGEGPDHPP